MMACRVSWWCFGIFWFWCLLFGLRSCHPSAEPANQPMRLPVSQMSVYGLQPVRESLILAQCKLCKKPIRLSAFADHLELCRRMTPSPPPAAVIQTPAIAQTAVAPPAAASAVEVMPRASSGPALPPVVAMTTSNPAPVSSTRIGVGASANNRAPPTPPRLLKTKKPQKQKVEDEDEDDDGNKDEDDDVDDEEEEDMDGRVPSHPVVGRKTIAPRPAGPPVPPTLSMRSASGSNDSQDRGRVRKEISVLEIRADNNDSNKVTIMVQSAAPVLTRAHRAGSAGGAAPLASRRWTRRNKLTGLSLSFKIRSDACDSDEEDEEEEEEEDDYYEGGDLSQGWAYTTQRRKVAPRNDTEDAMARKRKGPPPQVNNVSSKKIFYGEGEL